MAYHVFGSQLGDIILGLEWENKKMKLIEKKAAEYCETIKVDKDYCLDLTARYCDNEGRPFTPLTIYEAGWRAALENLMEHLEVFNFKLVDKRSNQQIAALDIVNFGDQEVEE